MATSPGQPASISDSPPDASRDHNSASRDDSNSDLTGAASTRIRDPRRYVILGEHGRGALGRVSRAHDKELGRDVAIKELINRDQVGEARFLREALLTARLEHPGIVAVHEAGRWPDGTLFYAMKLVSGRSLRELIAERPAVEQRIALLHHVIAVADAIAYAHRRNIIHRDLKPANVVVGEFGETIVIDWGLAKDLTTTDEPSLASGQMPSSGDSELTSVGTVLGTPAYMAPEQGRGEPVDQRADVYAIGVMLWELCAPNRVPPTQGRHRMLRQAGIDGDLATIIDKALDPKPARRYPDAGALAHDLRAFKSGARITARNYSALGALAHWTRRHRALAVSVSAALAIAVTGVTLYVRAVAIERDRADSSEQAAKRARASAETSLDELTLKHAQLLLATDPTAALDALASYAGSDRDRAGQIRAEAIGRGVAALRAHPHTDRVVWAGPTGPMSDGPILSLSTDGTLARTTADGSSIVLARGVSKSGLVAYAPSRHLLAYACDPQDLCLFDTARVVPVPVAAVLRGARASDAAFSGDGAALAVISQTGALRVLDITDPAHPVVRLERAIAGGSDVKFLDDHIVVVATIAGFEFVRLTGEARSFAAPDGSYWDTSASDHQLVFATTTGQASILDGAPIRVAARADLCHGPVVGLRFIPGRHWVAYACREGALGIWDPQTGAITPRAQLDGHADLVTTSQAGDCVVAADGNGTITMLDLATDLISSYKGHGFRLSALTPPTSEYRYLVSADMHGGVRSWPLPARFARVVATSGSAFNMAMFDRRSEAVTATTWLPALTTYSPSAGIGTASPHEAYNIFLEPSTTGRGFATYSRTNDVVELWSSAPVARTSVLRTGQGSIAELHYVADSDEFITAGHDGRLLRWTASGQSSVIAQFDQPIERFIATAAGPIVFSTQDGALWRSDLSGHAIALRGAGSAIDRLVADPGQATIYAGYDSGDVVALDLASWRQDTVLRTAAAVQQIALTGDGRTLVVATNDGVVHVGTRREARWSAGARWLTWAARARHLAVTGDGLVVVTCADGTIWLYAAQRGRWLCLPTGSLDLGRVFATETGAAAIALDQLGRLIWLDLDAARRYLDFTS
jgi:hypothetical protein